MSEALQAITPSSYMRLYDAFGAVIACPELKKRIKPVYQPGVSLLNTLTLQKLKQSHDNAVIV
jgi:hypothetical protein